MAGHTESWSSQQLANNWRYTNAALEERLTFGNGLGAIANLNEMIRGGDGLRTRHIATGPQRAHCSLHSDLRK